MQKGELRLGLAGQGQDLVVGDHGDLFFAVDLGGDLPDVLFVVEDLRVLHVVDGQDLGLGLVQVLGVAHVPAQVFRHLVARGEQTLVHLAPGVSQRVLGVDLVEGHTTVVRVDDHLDGVAQVVGAVRAGLRVGEAVGGGEGVPHPHQRAVVADHQIGVAVVSQEGGQCLHALRERPPVHDAGVLGEGIGEEEFGRAEAEAEGDLTQLAADRDPALTLVGPRTRWCRPWGSRTRGSSCARPRTRCPLLRSRSRGG